MPGSQIKEANTIATARLKRRYHQLAGEREYGEGNFHKGKRHSQAVAAAADIVGKHDWGYHGEMMRNKGISRAMKAKVADVVGVSHEHAEKFLQSSVGRHLTDALSSGRGYEDTHILKLYKYYNQLKEDRLNEKWSKDSYDELDGESSRTVTHKGKVGKNKVNMGMSYDMYNDHPDVPEGKGRKFIDTYRDIEVNGGDGVKKGTKPGRVLKHLASVINNVASKHSTKTLVLQTGQDKKEAEVTGRFAQKLAKRHGGNLTSYPGGHVIKLREAIKEFGHYPHYDDDHSPMTWDGDFHVSNPQGHTVSRHDTRIDAHRHLIKHAKEHGVSPVGWSVDHEGHGGRITKSWDHEGKGLSHNNHSGGWHHDDDDDDDDYHLREYHHKKDELIRESVLRILSKSEFNLFENTESQKTIHRIGLTLSDPNHPAVTKRREVFSKNFRIVAGSKERALDAAKRLAKRAGLKVHGHIHYDSLSESVGALERLRRATGAKTKPGGIAAAAATILATTIGGALAGGKAFPAGGAIGAAYSIGALINRMRKSGKLKTALRK